MVLKRKEVINKAINGILLAVVTINTFVNFLSKYVALILGLLVLGKLLYEYLPAITRESYGSFAVQQWVKLLEHLPVRVFIVCFAAPGYLFREVLDTSITLIMVTLSLVTSFAFAAWSNAKVKEPFGNAIGEVVGNRDFKNLGDYCKKSPDSLIKKIYRFLEWYFPGIVFSALCIFFSVIFVVISVYSQLFTIIFVGWIVGNILTRFKWKSKSPDIVKNLLRLPLAIVYGEKGIVVYLFVWGGFIFSGITIFNLFYQFPYTKAVNLLYLFLLSPPGIYQFVFWYAMLKRVPSFIDCWRNGSPKRKGFSLPAGELYAFITSCVYVCALFAFSNQLLAWRWIHLPLLSVMSFVYIVLILHTIKKWMKKEATDDIRKDNFRLPSAFLIQLTPCFVLLYKVNPFCSKEPLLPIMLLIGLAIVTSALFFIQDWRSFSTQRYGNGLTKDSLIYLLSFVFLLLANLFAYTLLSKDSFYLGLVLSIIAVFLMFFDICIKYSYRKKQLSRAKESCKANSINDNEEKK